MTGYEYICESISIFENSLGRNAGGKPIRTVAELARKTGYSVYHFTRLFSAVTGAYPKDYMSGRILSEAAGRIAETDASLASVAEHAGFRDYETFSRAFKKRFGVAPIRVRELRRIPSATVPRLAPEPGNGNACHADCAPATVERARFCLAGLPFFIDGGTVSFHRQWDIFMKAEKAVAGRVMPETYCQFTSWTADETVDGLSVLCALETEFDAAQPPLFSTRTVPAAAYLRFTHTGDISAIGETYRYIYQVWLASHDIKPLDLWEFQLYGNDATEIYIPVALR